MAKAKKKKKMIMIVLNRKKNNPFELEICKVANGCHRRPLTTTIISGKCQKRNMEIFYQGL